MTLKTKAFEAGFNDSVATAVTFNIFTRAPLQLTSFSFTTNGQFQVELQGLAGKIYIFQPSTNLTVCVFLSGAAELAYEIVFARYLGLLLGHDGNTPLAVAGIRAGDLILAMNIQPVEKLAAFRKITDGRNQPALADGNTGLGWQLEGKRRLSDCSEAKI